MRVGISGHQALPEEAVGFLTAEVRRVLSNAGPHLIGCSSLAAGADQMFAGEVLAQGGDLHVIVPCKDYRTTFEDLRAARRYDDLVSAASVVAHLPFPSPSEEAFLAAGLIVVERTDLVLAIWDGMPARGTGGTADVVEYARSIGTPVEVVWPAGVSR